MISICQCMFLTDLSYISGAWGDLQTQPLHGKGAQRVFSDEENELKTLKLHTCGTAIDIPI